MQISSRRSVNVYALVSTADSVGSLHASIFDILRYLSRHWWTMFNVSRSSRKCSSNKPHRPEIDRFTLIASCHKFWQSTSLIDTASIVKAWRADCCWSSAARRTFRRFFQSRESNRLDLLIHQGKISVPMLWQEYFIRKPTVAVAGHPLVHQSNLLRTLRLFTTRDNDMQRTKKSDACDFCFEIKSIVADRVNCNGKICQHFWRQFEVFIWKRYQFRIK